MAFQLVSEVPPSRLGRLVEDYLTNCRARGLSPRTIDTAYGFALRSVLLPWCEEHGVDRIEALDARTVDLFTADLLSRPGRTGSPLSKHTVHTYVRGVRQFLTWAERDGEPVASKPQLPKLPKRHREVLSRTELDRMEAAAPTERDRIIIRIFADCGLRLAEVTGLRVGDVRRSARQAALHVRGKGDRDRAVPVPPRLLRRLDRHIDHLPSDEANARLFVSLRRDPSGSYEPLTESGVAQIVRAAAARAGIAKKVHPHLIRHSWMTEMLRSGMNPIQLSVIAGASPQVIAEVYAHLTEDDAFDAMMRALTVSEQRKGGA